MVRSLLLLVTPQAVLLAGAWWRRHFAPVQLPAPAQTLALGEIQVARVVRNVLRRLDSRAARQFVRLEAAVAETLTVAGDHEVLDELLSALCAHAIETAPCGRVLVSAGPRAGHIAIAVTDDGIGVPSTRTAAVLELSQEGLALLGGTLETYRRRGVGSTTTILLPARRENGARPWDATVRNAMSDFARVTKPRKDAARKHAQAELAEGSSTSV